MIYLCYPTKCNTCNVNEVDRNLFLGELELKVKPFKGSKPRIMLVGQDPTISEREVDTVLDLSNKGGKLYKFIFGEILEPVGVTPEMVYATNLIKCRFPNNQTPKRICDNHKMAIKDFLQPLFDNCQRWFKEELVDIQPKIVIFFGEPAHQLLVENFRWDIPKQMKKAFPYVYQVQVCGRFSFTYVPCIHLNTKSHKHYQGLWDEFIEILSKNIESMIPIG